MNASSTITIIDGNRSIELQLQKNEAALFQYKFENCILKFNDRFNEFQANPLYNFNNADFFQFVLLIADASFQNSRKIDFSLIPNSVAIDKGNTEFAQITNMDILGVNRSESPDLEPYE